jgi:hypothetical protein
MPPIRKLFLGGKPQIDSFIVVGLVAGSDNSGRPMTTATSAKR